jgi:spore germination protein GerM
VAIQKNSRKKPVKKSPVFIFWFIFFVVILCLFALNWKAIRENLHSVGLLDQFTGRPANENPPELVSTEDTSWLFDPVDSPDDAAPAPEASAAPTAETPPEADPAGPAATSAEKTAPDAAVSSPAQPPASPPPADKPVPEKPSKPNVERALYFIRVDQGDGTIGRIKVNRAMPVSDSPMVDVLNTLLKGPTDAEKRQGLISLIPPGTRILGASIRGSTAYISFSEEFQINNTHGMVGYAAQLQQLVWTVTEFSTVKDVQVLIEGSKVDYLGGESIWIGSPISRDNF